MEKKARELVEWWWPRWVVLPKLGACVCVKLDIKVALGGGGRECNVKLMALGQGVKI